MMGGLTGSMLSEHRILARAGREVWIALFVAVVARVGPRRLQTLCMVKMTTTTTPAATQCTKDG